MWSRLEGTFYFPLPPDASLSRLAMYVGPKLMEGGMAERDYARQVFETIKTRQLDPALLEWVDGSTFKMRVFPLEGRQEKRIILSYTQKLDISYGRTRYRFPAGHNMKVVDDWSVKLRVKDGRGLLWDSPSHALKAKNEGRDLVLTAEEKLSRLDKDVVLFLNDDSIVKADVGRNSNPSRADGKSASLSTTTHEDAHYLMLRWRPDLPVEKVRERRDWIFLFESSADRDPLLARTQIEIIRTVMNHAEHDDTFTIVTAGAYASAFEAEPLPATPENVTQAIKYLEQTHLVGGLDLQQAFRSLATFAENAENAVILHVGSGTPILGEREQNELLQSLPSDAQYVGVGVGKRYNRSLMKLAAARTGGHFTQINPDESISWRGFELVSALNTPRLLDIKVETDSGACRMLSLQDALSHGEELCALGRYEEKRDAPRKLTITGQLDGKAFQQVVKVNTEPALDWDSWSKRLEAGASPIPRMWAKQQIELLTSLGAEQHKEQIIKLSKAMYVMSPFTSLLVLENDAMYEQYKIDRGRKDHWALYPAPETIEVVEEKDEGRTTNDEEKPEESGETSEEGGENDDDAPAKPSVEEVLGTILVHRPAPVLYWPDRGYHGSHTTTVLQARNVGYGLPFATVATNVYTPDGGTVLVGGVRRTSGVPMNAKLPQVTSIVPIVDDSHSMFFSDTYGTNGVVPAWIVPAWRGEINGKVGLSTQTWATHDFRVPGSAWDVNGRYINGTLPFVFTGRERLNINAHGRLAELTWGLGQRIPPGGAQAIELYDPRGVGYSAADFTMNDLLRGAVHSSNWEDVNGNGTIDSFPGNLSLVISQTESVNGVQRWGQVPMSFDGRMLITGGTNGSIRLWNRQTDGGFYYTPPGLYGDYDNSVDWYVRNRIEGRPLGVVAQLQNARLDITRRSAELSRLQAELASERAGRAFALAALQEARQIESDLRRFDSVGIPARYRHMVSDYYRLLGRGESGEIDVMVDRFNSLLDEHRFREAEAVAETARWAFPDEEVVETMVWKSRFVRRVREARHRGHVTSLFSVDVADIPFVEDATELPEVHYWRELNGGRSLTYQIGGQALPSPNYMLDDVQYFAPGPEFKLTREAAARRAFVQTQRELLASPWVLAPVIDRPELQVLPLIAEIRDPEITIAVDLGQPRTIKPKRPVVRWRITNPNVVEANRVNGRDLVLHGKTPGITTLTLWHESDSDEPEVLRYLVRVAMDDDEVDELTGQLEELVASARTRRDGQRQTLASYVLARSEGRIGQPNVYFERPQFTGSNEVFSRLASYAPGLNTSAADVYAILEDEANVARPLRGSVDAGARRLINRARNLGWQHIIHPDAPGIPAFGLFANGAGQYRYDRRTRFGLRETVLCDGETLRHRYEEIGLGATRKLSRLHRQQFTSMVPWAVAPADDLALSADVRLVNDNTIAVVPLYAELGLPYTETQLVFGKDSRLVERRLVAQPAGQALLHITYQANGTVTWLDGNRKELHSDKLS